MSVSFDKKDIAGSTKRLVKGYTHELIDSFKTILGLDESKAANDAYQASIQSDSLAGLLPYLGWDETSKLFILDEGNKDTSKSNSKKFLGFTLECHPQTGADDSMERILQAMYIQSPPGTSISIHNFADPNIMPIVKDMATRRHQDSVLGIKKDKWQKRNINVYQKMARKRIDYLLNGTSEPLFNDQNLMIRNYRVIISVAVPLSPEKSSNIDAVMLLRDQIKSTLGSANLFTWDWTPSELINFTSDFFDSSRLFHIPTRVEKEYQPEEQIRHQISAREVESNIGSEEITFKNAMSSKESVLIQMSVSQFPRFHHLSMTGNFCGDFFQNSLSYPCPFMVTTSAIVQDYDGTRNRAALKTASAQRKTEGYMAKIDPLIQEEAFEWKNALKAIEDGGTLIKMATSITLIAPKEKASRVRSEVMGIWRSNGFRLASDKYQQLVSLLSVMPMSLTPSLASDLNKMGRFSTKYSQNAVSLSPFVGEWKGSGTPVMTFVGRKGQLVSVDLFDNSAGNYNFAIVGTSGSGKSFVTQEILFSYRSNGAKIWVIDVGRSYENVCKLIDGDFIEFTEDSDICINPFSTILDLKDELDMLKSLIGNMMSPSNPLTDWQKSTIEQAITQCFAKLGTKMTITDLANYFLEGCGHEEGECDPRLHDMGVMLFPWTKDGIYGQYFEGEANISFTNDFTVLELEELKGKKDLQAVVLMIMMFRITQEMYLSRDSKKVVMIDEAWELMASGMSSDFIETGYRRARKYGGAFGTSTQNYADYSKSPASEAALQNADWTFTLRQKSESIDFLEENGMLGLGNDPFKQRAMRDLKTVGGRYSEMMISYPLGSGIVRFLAEPFTGFLYSSKHEQFQKIQDYKEQGYSVADAVEKSMDDFNIKDIEPIVYR